MTFEELPEYLDRFEKTLPAAAKRLSVQVTALRRYPTPEVLALALESAWGLQGPASPGEILFFQTLKSLK